MQIIHERELPLATSRLRVLLSCLSLAATSWLIACGDGGDDQEVSEDTQICQDLCERSAECDDINYDCQLSCEASEDAADFVGDLYEDCENKEEMREHLRGCVALECTDNELDFLQCTGDVPDCQ